MPLKDSFIKKQQQPEKLVNLIELTTFPTEEDLKIVHATAIKNPKQTQLLTWKNQEGEYQLSVKHARSADENEALWVLTLQKGENDSTVLWNYMTPDVELIDSMIEAAVKTSEPKAVIPDSLKRAPGEEFIDTAESNKKQKQQEAKPPVKTEEAEPPRRRQVATEEYEAIRDPGWKALPGCVLLNRYEIVNEVGRGGMGVVYKARHLKMDRMVAIKLLHGHLVEDAASKKRFEQEVTATSSLSHPNCVLVHDFDFSPAGQPFLVMEYMEGVSLKDVLKQSGPLGMDEYLSIMIQCCEGLAHAHSKGIIHRDMKPSNVMLVRGDNGRKVKIVDFGVAKIMPRNDGTLMELTRTGDVVGSPHYMSPEQCMGSALDWRSDIYSLGCVMYEAITGRVPLLGENPYQAMYMHIHEVPPMFGAVRPGFQPPLGLEEIVFRAMAKQLHERYQSAQDVANDLKRYTNPDTASTLQPPTAMPYQASQQPIMPPMPGMMPGYPMPMPGMPMGYPPQMMPGMYPNPYMQQPGQMPPYMMPGAPPVPANQAPMQQPAAPAAPAAASPVPQAALDPVLELIKSAGLVKDSQIEEAKKMKEQHGGELVAMLVASGAVKRCVKDAAVKCKPLVDNGHLKPDYAITLLNLCHKKDLKYEDAINELGWRLG